MSVILFFLTMVVPIMVSIPAIWASNSGMGCSFERKFPLDPFQRAAMGDGRVAAAGEAAS